MAARPGAERPPQSWRIAVVGGALVLAALYWMGGAGTAAGGQGACGRGMGALPLPELKKRTDLARVLEERGFKTGAELGVQVGLVRRGWRAHAGPCCGGRVVVVCRNAQRTAVPLLLASPGP
jgi:hypothetical protein